MYNEIKKLKSELDEKDKETSSLKKIEQLKEKIEYWKDTFKKIIHINNKGQGLLGDKDKENTKI